MTEMAEIALTDIVPNPTQPRSRFDEEALDGGEQAGKDVAAKGFAFFPVILSEAKNLSSMARHNDSSSLRSSECRKEEQNARKKKQ